MQPTSSRIDLPQLQEYWQQFVSHGRLSPNLDPLVAISWHRCALRLDPLSPLQWTYISDKVLPLTLGQHSALLSIARPIMEDIHQFIEGSGALFLLADSTSCILEQLGNATLARHLSQLGLRQGGFLDESRIGTNAFAVALTESSPVQIVGAEHFLREFHNLSSVAAPIFDLEGHPVGVIGFFELAELHSPQSLGIVVAAAKAIENQIQADMLIHDANAQATELNATLDAVSQGILAWTAGGIITHLNNQGGVLLGLKPTVVDGRPLAEYITLPADLARAAARGEELTDVEISFNVNGAPREFLASLRVIRNAAGDPFAFIATFRPIAQVHRLVSRLVGAQARLTLDDIVGHGSAARRVRRQALTAAQAKGGVLLVGENGTGKNVLARAIHNSGNRAGGPFMAINCQAIPRELMLGEFLGFEPGAFNSGPSSGQPSKLELVSGGTLLLQEVEALTWETQSALARAIESGEIIRLGGRRVIPLDVRIIASTDVDLEERVADGTFRPDLYFRLTSFVIQLPALRERPEDIPLLIDRFLERLSLQFGSNLTMMPSAKRLLCNYPWPGNVTELESIIDRAALRSEGKPIRPDHLPEIMQNPRAKVPRKVTTEAVPSWAQAEKLAIMAAGRASHGNTSQMSKLLGIGRTTLWRKMKSLGLTPEDFSD